MQTSLCFKSNEGMGQLNVSHSLPWWIGTQHISGENFNQLKLANGHAGHGIDQNSDKDATDTAKFSVIQVNKESGKTQKTQQHSAKIALSSPFEYQVCFELGLGQSTNCSNTTYVDPCYGLCASYGAQSMYGRKLLPPNMTADMPIYVNAKQYHGIVRRRQARAKAEMANKLIRVRKPYLHESRHRHAMRRERGSGGRFLNTKKESMKQNPSRDENTHSAQFTKSPNSVLHHTNSGNLYSGRTSGSEISTIYSRDDSEHFNFGDHLHPSIYMMGGGGELLKV